MVGNLAVDQFFHERGFSRKIGFGKRPALLVIDFILASTNPDAPLGADYSAELAATNLVLQECRNKNIPVFFTTVAYSEANLEDAGIWFLKIKGLSTLIEGTEEVKIDPVLNRQPDEPIITKKYASSFFGTDLASRLVSRRVDTVILTGATTSGCVRATAVDAIQMGFRPIVVKEAVGDRSKAAHEQSLFDLNSKYADVETVDSVCAFLRQL